MIQVSGQCAEKVGVHCKQEVKALSETVLMRFFHKIDQDFTPSLSHKTNLDTYGEKLLKNAKLFVSYTEDGEIKGLVAIYAKMKEANVLGRRYFYPLISEFSTYRGLESADPANLPNAHKMADSVLCLPMHHALSDEDIERTLDCIIKRYNS